MWCMVCECDFSVIPTTELNDQSSMPTCTYSVRSGTLDGPPVTFAKVGDKVVHRWECDSGEIRSFSIRCLSLFL